MSILNEIRNRLDQPTVAPRQDALMTQQQLNASNDNHDNQVEVAAIASQSQPISELQQLEDELAGFPETAPRLPIRLEAQIKQDIDVLCNQEKITIETLLEAFYTTCKDKDALMRQVLKEAKKRIVSRKTAGNLRSNITRLKNIKKTQ